MKSITHKLALLVASMLRELDYEVQHFFNPDLIGFEMNLKAEDNRFGIGVKTYRSKRIPLSIIRNALIDLHKNIKKANYFGGILIVTSNIPHQIIDDFREEFGIVIFDRGILFHLAQQNEQWSKILEILLLDLVQDGYDDIYAEMNLPDENFSINLYQLVEIDDYDEDEDSISSRLKKLPKGRDNARKFEVLGEEILKYIFENDFSNWQNQNSTNDSLHRFDLISKIASTNDFWKSLSRDFKSRFVVFEFKNYSKSIKQGQVYTTEKYLFKSAMRSIAIIISRVKADKNAYVAMEGALRENGKLILNLDDSDILKLIEMKKRGEDPNTLLSEILDEFLMKLSR